MSHSPDRHGAALLERMAARLPSKPGGDCADASGADSQDRSETEACFRNIADNIPGLVFQRALNADGTISFPFVNDGAWSIAGLDPARIKQNPALLSENIHPDDLPALHAAVLQSFADLRAHSNEFRYNHPTAGWRWILTISRPRRRRDGTIVAEAIAFDITDRKITEHELDDNRKRLNEHLIELQDTKERLEQRTNELIRTVNDLAEARDASDIANRAKSDFLATMSHEIRTPMNGVLGMASLLKQTALEPTQQEFVDTIEQSGAALLSIINDVLDYSKMEAGQLELDPTAFSVLDVIDNAVQLVRPKCSENRLTMQSFVAPGVPDVVIGDAGRLRQILLNLLSNAAKFTKDGHIGIECFKPRQVGRVLEFQFAVRDTGIGVSAEAQERLFEVFSQADASTTRRFGGTGLGLSICRRLCHLMGGEISVESELGRGSTFRFNLKFTAPETATETGPGEMPRVRSDANDKTAFVTAGALFPDSGLQRQLSASGLRVEACDDAETLISRLDEPAAADGLIIVDADTVSSAPDLQERLQSARDNNSQTIWLVRRDQRQTDNHGIAISIDLPLRQARLREHIRNFVDGGAASASALPAAAPIEPPVSLANQTSPLAKALLVEDNKVNQRVAIAMLEAAGINVTLAENGKIALDILSTERFDIILMDIHMPEMDGITASRKIRELPPPQCDTPIIALTANAMKGDREKYLDAGMNDYVSKPIDPAALSDAIVRQTGIAANIGPPRAAPRQTPPAPSITEEEVDTLFAGIDGILD